MKATNLNHICSEPAPKEWHNITDIKKAKPSEKKCEISLQKLQGLNVCIWMIRKSVYWVPASDFFYIEK